MQAGARPERRNLRGMDALCCAAIGGHLPLLPALMSNLSDSLPDAMLHAAVAGQTRTALALAELYHMPHPPPAAPDSQVACGIVGEVRVQMPVQTEVYV